MIELLQRLGYAPRLCVWELTLACDMHCRHCGSSAGAPRPNELDGDEAKRLVEDLAELGCKKVTLGGGEPTLHPDWSSIASDLVSHGVRTNLISNGWSWTSDHARQALDAGMHNVAFSLDGLEDTHDEVRSRSGSFGRVVAAIGSCAERGLPASVVTHINHLNLRSLPALRDLLAELGVASWQLQMGNPVGEMRRHEDLVVDPRDLLWLIPQIAELRESTERPIVLVGDNIGYYGRYEKAIRDQGGLISFWVGCRAGCHVVGIESDGGVKGCLSLPSRRLGEDEFLEGNVRDRPLAEIWNDPSSFAYNRELTEDRLAGFCRVCRYRDICRGGCSWTAHTRSGSRYDNPLCFHRVAIEQGRYDLLADEPTEAELAAVATR